MFNQRRLATLMAFALFALTASSSFASLSLRDEADKLEDRANLLANHLAGFLHGDHPVVQAAQMLAGQANHFHLLTRDYAPFQLTGDYYNLANAFNTLQANVNYYGFPSRGTQDKFDDMSKSYWAVAAFFQ